MRLHFLVPGDLSAPTGGYGYDRRLIAGLAALGHEVVHVPLPDGFPFPDDPALAAAEAAFAALPDGALLLADGLAYGVLDDLAARHGDRLRIAALCHHPLGRETGLAAAVATRLEASERAALALARAVIVTSPATAETLAADFAVPTGKITVALPGTDPRPAAPRRGDPPVLLTLASLIPRKGHDVLVEALDRIRDRRWIARFVGGDALDPAWAARLRADVAARGLSDRILFPGPVSDPDPEYFAADIFVLPSRYEGYGMAFAEALAYGLPVVAARAGAVPDVVPGSAGLLVPPDDAGALVEALAALIGDDDLRARLGAGAREAGALLPAWTDTAATVAAVLMKLETR